MTDIRPPREWADAFAALPLETPPATAADRFGAQLRARPRTRPRRRWPALAAALCALAAVPAALLMDAARHAPPAPAVAVAPSPSPSHAGASREQPASQYTAATPIVPAPLPAAPSVPTGHRSPVVATPAPRAELQQLHGESARLEALLAELYDGGDGDAVRLALSASLQAQVVGIDDALALGSLDAEARTGLWRERVDLLRQLASLAADQRLAALYGSREYAVLPVY